MAHKSCPLSKVYGVLKPGPVILVTTAHQGQQNIMTPSWHTMLEFEPPLVGCVISDRNHSFELLKASKECVINIPTVELADKVVGCGNTSGTKTNKFKRFGLTPLPAKMVGAPLIKECHVNLECRVVVVTMVSKFCLVCPGGRPDMD
jgi:flavin reductase (DIM6/NTAB) family NADH-FMN oxidoreductase RutF